jgi:hypothetical protein
MSVTSDGSPIIPRTRGREECEASGVTHPKTVVCDTRDFGIGGAGHHGINPKLGLTVNFTPTKRPLRPTLQL